MKIASPMTAHTAGILRRFAKIDARRLPSENAEHAQLSQLLRTPGLPSRVIGDPSWKEGGPVAAPSWLKINSVQLVFESLRDFPRPEVAALFSDLRRFHVGELLMFAKSPRRFGAMTEDAQSALGHAVDLWVRRQGGVASDAPPSALIAAYEAHLPAVSAVALAEIDLGYGRHLNRFMQRRAEIQGVQFGEMLALALRHHENPDLARYYDGVEPYHFPAQMVQPWRERTGCANGRISAAVAEVCGLLEREGRYLTEEALAETPLRYHGVRLGPAILAAAACRGIMHYLPPGVRMHAKAKIGGKTAAPVPARAVYTGSEEKCHAKLEELLGVSDKTTDGDYIKMIEARLRTDLVEGIDELFREPSPAGGYVNLVIQTLRKNPRPAVAHYFQHLQPFHFRDAVRWRVEGTVNWPQVEIAVREGLQCLVLQHLKRWPIADPGVEQLVTDAEFGAALNELIPRWRKGHAVPLLVEMPLRYGGRLGNGIVVAMTTSKFAVTEPIARVLRLSKATTAGGPIAKIQAYHLQTVITWSQCSTLVDALVSELGAGLFAGREDAIAQRLYDIAQPLSQPGGFGSSRAGYLANRAPMRFGISMQRYPYFATQWPQTMVRAVHGYLTASAEVKWLEITVPALPAEPTAENSRAWFLEVFNSLQGRRDVTEHPLKNWPTD